ncbi:HEAT repeat domain-containing protein [Acinetobacter calcoaceticus]|uniref:HEAT repeat domain-containing protein n=1 Tax=Acinetobacter calcoaceticus TaxID=471 RepID=UPI0019026CFD|nr:HEAT repeat domain-containing protein [Acinetobacter calcoaceticus]MBJ9721603.1 HEAT repeat domain-containing protein [Acinetobacter calcoaceticus]
MSFYYQALDDLDEYNQEFLAQLNHQDEKVRFVALMNIGDEENPDLLPWLHAALQHDSSALVREEAAKKLESWEDPTSLQVLAQALSDADMNVRQAASQSLSEVKNAASAQILAPYLKHSDTFTLSSILRALKPLRPQQLFAEISALVHHEAVLVRREAVSALSWLKRDQAITILAKTAQADTDDEVRRIATGGLAYGQNISAEVIQSLKHSLAAESWQLRVEAAFTIGKLRIVQLEAPLIYAVSDLYWQVRIAAVRSLGLLKSHLAVAYLFDNFKHEISNLRKEVALALGEIGTAEAQCLLEQHQNDPDPEVRKAIRIGLNQIGEVKYANQT